jgi:hypothetical protein
MNGRLAERDQPQENSMANVTTAFHDSQERFEHAIKTGILSATPNTPNYAGDFMYMGTEAGRDLFKNIVTRKYLPSK